MVEEVKIDFACTGTKLTGCLIMTMRSLHGPRRD